MLIMTQRLIKKCAAFYILLLITLVSSSESVSYSDLIKNNIYISEDGRLNFTELASKYGHPAEEHDVITEDGYILKLFHLPGDQTKPVLLVHGNTVDADCFIVRGNTSLAITLANRGHDVWVISLRGTGYSQRHISIDPLKEPTSFFNYSFHEEGIYDIPATIDYILQKTGQTQVLAVGYSIGTTVFYVMGAEKPEYNEKVKLLISMAPICFLKHQRGVLNLSNYLSYVINAALSITGLAELGGKDHPSTYLLQSYCLRGLPSYDKCVKGLAFGVFGPDEAGFEPEFMSTFFGHFPASTSSKSVFHLSQIYLRDKFFNFDYGAMMNRQVYRRTQPPEFDLSKVTMKVALLVGQMDFLATVKDVKRLSSLLPNVVHHQVLPYKNFNHLDFVYGRYMSDNLYPYLFDLIDKYI